MKQPWVYMCSPSLSPLQKAFKITGILNILKRGRERETGKYGKAFLKNALDTNNTDKNLTRVAS